MWESLLPLLKCSGAKAYRLWGATRNLFIWMDDADRQSDLRIPELVYFEGRSGPEDAWDSSDCGGCTSLTLSICPSMFRRGSSLCSHLCSLRWHSETFLDTLSEQVMEGIALCPAPGFASKDRNLTCFDIKKKFPFQ